MKKFFMVLAVAAVAVCMAVPAMADIKMTTTGYMNVRGLYLDGNIRNVSDTIENKSSNAWYLMEMVIDPTLHINDKVRIHGRVTVMERRWNGGGGGEFDTNSFGIDGNYRAEHNFWWEQLYLSFPLFDGHLYVGRMGGGDWAYPFQDFNANRDRVKYVRKVGNITLLGLWEKLSEGDGGLPLTSNPTPTDNFTNSFSDTESYAVGAVVPFSKEIMWRPLVYYIQYQTIPGYRIYIANALTLKMGPFFFDGELGYNMRTDEYASGDIDYEQWSLWLDTGMNFGPAQLAVGGFYIQGEDDNLVTEPNSERQGITTTGTEFQPLLLLFSEDLGLLFNSNGVTNGTGSGRSGYQAIYLRAAYKLSDTMKVSGIFGYLMADQMKLENTDDDLGMEIDLKFEWKLMDNLTYVIEAGYLMAGSYWDDADGNKDCDLSNDVLGMRHMLEIKW